MLFNAIFLTLFFLTWSLLALLPWIALSIRRQAHGAIWAFPFALAGGAAGGILVPLLGLNNGIGIGVSMLTAPAGGAFLSMLAFLAWDRYTLGRRFARLGLRQPTAPQRR